ncbi:sodium/hydrogen exchanger [Richelia sinica FACHB-800]|uniref:Sodium/hydrogen exchanger n=1 Tax=Richelia sinica FACHB-800 TaxID=1357546 RepID=A0A975T6F9_9NOST|nr:cation:proton antiporter [Richelia sinica]MBD2666112.1 cation:proton antiporter [Richelia sinica FACHB-800]QXE23106.1 sodium/hydrogen exchanger [Richelia sinica FACHB-800]
MWNSLLQVLALELNSQVRGQELIVPMLILLVVILIVPMLFDHLKLPGLVGLVGAGVCFSQFDGNLFRPDGVILELLSEIGLVYLIFIAGLEFDLPLLRQNQGRSLWFGGLSFGLTLFLGTGVGQICGYSLIPSVLIGCLLTSSTLLAYPILNGLGLIKHPAIALAVSSTIVTDMGTLLVFAVLVAVAHVETLTLSQLLITSAWVIAYFLAVVLGFNQAGKAFFLHSGDDNSNKLLFVLLCIFVATMVAQVMGIPTIVAVFLAGVAVNEAIGEGPVKEKLVFIGSFLFIPIFFFRLGLILNISGLIHQHLLLWLTLIVAIASKFLAAGLAKFLYRYRWTETLTMCSVSIPLMGTTLAVAVEGVKLGFLPPPILDTVIILMLMTTTLGVWLTNYVGVNLTNYPASESAIAIPTLYHPPTIENGTIVVPLVNSTTQQNLIELAALLASQTHGKIVPLAIAPATAQMDAPQLELACQQSERLLARATAQSQLLGVPAKPLLRIDDAIASGITRAAREKKADLIILNWDQHHSLRARLFGNLIDNVLWSAHCPVALTRLVESPKRVQRILVPIENLITPTLEPVQLAQTIAQTNQAQVTVLNVCVNEACRKNHQTAATHIAARRSHLEQILAPLALANPPELQIIIHDNFTQAILQAARLYDLIVLPFHRYRHLPGGLVMSDLTTQLARQLTCSMIILSQPPHNYPTVLPTRTSRTNLLIS